MTVEERVAKGVEALNATFPDWFKSIDLSTLNMGDYEHCILGQLGRERCYSYSMMSDLVTNFGDDFEFGFDISEEGIEYYSVLKDEWFEQIHKLRSA